MDVSHIFDPLNEAQREAVAAPPGPILVLAGAGSGKTRVLTHRIAYLIEGHQVLPASILAVTFTNKAAREMRGRIGNLFETPPAGLWIGTFHGLCHRLLRLHHEDAGLSQDFEILDQDDQYRLIRRILKELDLDENHWPPRLLQRMIGDHKEAAIRPETLPTANDGYQQTFHQIYLAYENRCRRSGLVDFAELLLRAVELFRNNQIVRELWQNRFRHVLVDEFQDTNSIQYQWLRILSARHQSLFAVGDDDQSIFGWRGARVENVLSFEKDFEQANVFRLEQNYRSTSNILNAANAVIANNARRMGKQLWTDQPAGAPVRVYTASDEIDESRFVTSQIQDWVGRGNRRDQTAILYRSNAQSRVFEEQLIRQGIPYRVYGGFRFFERAEIKDALAYLRLISNRDSDPAFERIVNLPTRGIGSRTLEVIRQRARTDATSLWNATTRSITRRELPGQALTAVGHFQDLINRIAADTETLELAEMTDQVLQRSGLLEHHGKGQGEIARTRVENLKELVNATRNYVAVADEDAGEEAEMDALALFLAQTSLEAAPEQAEERDDCVQLMSLHSAKGLEFPLVFLCGMEDGLLPHQKCLEEANLEEERRLCYVGITRAMRQLYLCHATIRRLYGKDHYTEPSRFFAEIPERCIEQVRDQKPDHKVFRGSFTSTGNGATPAAMVSNGLIPGQRVRHGKFGEGMVLSLEGQGTHARVQVNFHNAGTKWLICDYANLEPV